MAFLTLDYQAVRDNILRDIANQPRSDGQVPNVALDGDYAIRANATGSAVEGLYQHQQWIVRQLFADTADTDYLEKMAAQRGITLKLATVSTGSATFTGTVGSAIAIGTEAKSASGIAVVTTAAATIGAGGTVAVAVQASLAGIGGNLAVGEILTLTAPPAGVQSTAAVVSMSGGTDIETYASLLARYLFDLQNPPCGGAAHDYYKWAMTVAGVTAAYVYSNRRGLGTTDVIIMTTGGIPDATLVSNTQTYIDGERPVQADALVFAPTAVPVNVAGALVLASGYVLATVSAAIQTSLVAYFATLKPGDTVYLKRVEAIISDTPGVVDFTLTSPLANVVTLVDSTHTQLATLGTVTF
jgi:uncharacterized phage protein gp47/JayE